ncbi:ATP12-domain-containing protein [Morchella conica CCBAS932]|uniref:ATP12-domain-containing protein n=1 Tax=Morchella conica CCBAS932 TaxID=1392247 RepID=A0A3N4KRR1_9PEZI|nr:ATP12-domain-containing protein [Morchella conica CCBAS932]
MSRLLPRLAARTRITASTRPFLPASQCLLHTSSPAYATPLPITAHGPPPKPPLPAGEIADLRRRQKLERAENTLLSAKGGRFWKEVSVIESSNGALGINLDTRPLKTPTKQPILIPRTKPILAAAIALEWSLLRTSADALKSYLIPLTGLASRAIDLQASEAEGAAPAASSVAKRDDIVENLLRYLDTDTLLCFAPTTPPEEGRKSLREMQEESARPITAFMTTNVWPGVKLVPVDGDEGLIAVEGQPQETRDVIRSWIERLGVWDLVGLERAVLATKSLLIAARLVAEWSEEMQFSMGREKVFGAEEAAEAASVEVRFQTGRWGEVEDTHDVEKEDLKRQLGAARMLVSGVKNLTSPSL